TDNSVEIIKKYEPWITYWESKKDRGQAHAINKGMLLTSGDLLAWLNSDDFYLPHSLKHVANAYAGRGDGLGAIVGLAHKVNHKGDIIYTPKIPELNFHAFLNWLNYSHFLQPSCFFLREAWKDVGPLNEDLNYCFDLDLWLRISMKYSFIKLERVLSHATVHDAAKTTADRDRMRVEICLLIMKYGGEEIARRELFRMADELTNAKAKLGQRSFFSRIGAAVAERFSVWRS
ncbi:MAG: glycosyltransferase, partial [Methanobacteriota archaeon]